LNRIYVVIISFYNNLGMNKNINYCLNLFFADGPVRLYRDVVLLTDDRNLRLKAHTHNVPVKDVPSFMHWSKIT